MTSQPQSSATLPVICQHGSRPSAVVCRHVLGPGLQRRGWVENSPDPDDLQGWCLDCEAMFQAEGGKTDAFLQFNDYAIVCDVCYGEIVAFHSAGSASS